MIKLNMYFLYDLENFNEQLHKKDLSNIMLFNCWHWEGIKKPFALHPCENAETPLRGQPPDPSPTAQDGDLAMYF